MCGIVGYVGHRDCVSIIMEGLKRLEYRGYDSAGIALHGEGALQVVKAVTSFPEAKFMWSLTASWGAFGGMVAKDWKELK